MSDASSSPYFGSTLERPETILTPEFIDAHLHAFRSWLLELAASPPPEIGSLADEAEPVDMHTLLGQFTALRQEIHLLTKASRTQQEQNSALIQSTERAVELVRARPAPESGGTEEVRSLLKALVDLEDNLSLAHREMERVDDSLEDALDRLAELPQEAPPAAVATPAAAEPTSPPAALTFWQRLGFGRPALTPALSSLPATTGSQEPLAEVETLLQIGARLRDLFDSMGAGYKMSLDRAREALRKQSLEPIVSKGMPFDPERMEVLEAVSDSGRPSGEVIDEVRKGYMWKGRVFRFAQVTVAR